MVYREAFLQIHKRFIRQFIQECSILWVDFSITGNIPVQASMERLVIENGDRDSNNNRSWAKWLKSQTVSQFSVPIFWNLRFQRNAKRNRLEERFKRKDGVSSPFENNLNHSAGLNGNCTTPSSCEFGIKCAWMHHQIGEQSSQKPKWKLHKAEWLKFSGNVEYAWQLVKNASGRRAPKSSWKPRKSTKSWDQLSVHKFTKSHTVTEKGPSRGKMVLPSLVAWRACTKIRDAPAEKRRQSKFKEAQRELRCYFSGVSQHRIEREF